jgi:hypothetical protein
MQGVGVISHRGDGGSESLGLNSGPVLSLEGLGDRLVGHLASGADSMDQRGVVGNGVDHRGMVGNSVDNRGVVGNSNRGSVSNSHRGMVDHRVSHSMSHRGSLNHSLRVRGSSLIGHLSHISINIVGVIADMLDTAVRESHRVRSSDDTSSIVGLCLLEVGVGVVISHSIVVGVGGSLGKVLTSVACSMSHSVDHRGVVGNSDRGSVDNRGMVGDGDRGMVDERSVVGNSYGGSVDKRGMVGNGHRGNGDDSIMSNGTRGFTKMWLDLRQALEVIHLGG